MSRKANIKFFIDQCVPDSVAHTLTEKGYQVTLLREILPTDTPDPIVAATCEQSGAVLVSYDRDFKVLATRLGMGKRRFNKLSRLSLRCTEPKAAERVNTALSLIEAEWQIFQKTTDKRIFIEILGLGIKTIR